MFRTERVEQFAVHEGMDGRGIATGLVTNDAREQERIGIRVVPSLAGHDTQRRAFGHSRHVVLDPARRDRRLRSR
jgi:predicted GNAT family acetyltransferase